MNLLKYNLFIFLLFFNGLAYSQIPDAISYQAVIRDANNHLHIDRMVKVKITILSDSINGEPVYEETHQKSTDDFGLLELNIGEGDPMFGSFSEIKWSESSFYLTIQMDINGGNNYTIQTQNKFLSVPYAFHAKYAESLVDGVSELDPVFRESIAYQITHDDITHWNFASNRPNHFVGELFGGGIVFYVDKNGEFVLIASLDEPTETIPWSNSNLNIFAGAINTINGQANKDSVLYRNIVCPAVTYCEEYSDNDFDDWYLPAIDELFLLFRSKYELNKAIEQDTTGIFDVLGLGCYWSSTERSSNEVYSINLGNLSTVQKDNKCLVRPIRKMLLNP